MKIERSLLNEGVSETIYHFTSVPNAYKIVSQNAYMMQVSYAGSGEDDYGGKLFYMSATRNKNTAMSYAHNYNSRKSGARIELDGTALNQRFKGMSVDYWTPRDSTDEDPGLGKRSYYHDRRGDGFSDSKKAHQDNEYEDRILSNEPMINDFMRYVKRIDVFCIDGDCLYFAKEMALLANGKCHIYDNIHDFNYQTKTEITEKVLSDYSMEGPRMREVASESHRNRRNLVDLAASYFCMKYMDHPVFDEDVYGKVGRELREWRFDGIVNDVIGEMKNMSHYEDIGSIIRFGDNVKNYQNAPTPDGQRMLSMIARYMRSMGFKNLQDIRKYATIRRSKENQRYDIDTKKKLQGYAYIYKDDDGTRRTRSVSLHPETDSFWKFIFPSEQGFPSFEYRKDFVREIYDRQVNDGKEGRRHGSKTDEGFWKYLLHIAHSDISVEKMIEILDKLEIPLSDDDVFSDSKIVRREFDGSNAMALDTYPEDFKIYKS